MKQVFVLLFFITIGVFGERCPLKDIVEYHPNGQISMKTHYDYNCDPQTTYYNPEGKIIKTLSYNDGEKRSLTTYLYTSFGALSEKMYRYYKSGKSVHTQYTYNDDHKIETEYSVEKRGRETNTNETTYKYDGQGSLVKKYTRHTSAHGSYYHAWKTGFKWKHEYEDGSIVRTRTFERYPNGKTRLILDEQFDKKGNVLSKSHYNFKGLEYVKMYKYNDLGKVIYDFYQRYKQPLRKEYWITYDDSGTMIKKTYSKNSSMPVTIYEYVSILEYTNETSISRMHERFYDEDGILQKDITYSGRSSMIKKRVNGVMTVVGYGGMK